MSSNSVSNHASSVVRDGHLCSGHVLINYERQLRHLPLLRRSRSLDMAARKAALQIAQSCSAYAESIPCESEFSRNSTAATNTTEGRNYSSTETNRALQQQQKQPQKQQRQQYRQSSGKSFDTRPEGVATLVQSVLRGGHWTNVRQLHSTAMYQGLSDDCQNKNYQDFRENVLSPFFTQVGHATARAGDGSLVLVQVFRGSNSKEDHNIQDDDDDSDSGDGCDCKNQFRRQQFLLNQQKTSKSCCNNTTRINENRHLSSEQRFKETPAFLECQRCCFLKQCC
ncbi:hypothetical protein ACA910_009339 [Epithemia clementina (nom. ined.)]